MRILALSRREAERYTPENGREVCVSIVSPGSRVPHLSPRFRDLLRLEFDDVDRFYLQRLRQLDGPPPVVPLQPEQAREIAAFYRTHRERDAIVVHCEAGVSRSVGVARALHEEETGAGPEASREAFGRGNELVRQRVREALEGREGAEE